MPTLSAPTFRPRSDLDDALSHDVSGQVLVPPPSTLPAVGTSDSVDRFVLFPARAFLAFGWIRAGVEKLIEPGWWSGAELRSFLWEQNGEMLPFVRPFTDALVMSQPAITAALVVLVELALGLALLTGRRLMTALLGASALNVVFVLLGVVTPSAFYLVIQITLLLACAAASGWFTRFRRAAVAVASGAAALALTPFIATIHPAEVIHDPAIMLATLAGLIGASQVLRLVSDHLGLN